MKERIISLDVLRGITIMMMILVNNPGSWGNIFAPLEHAEWNGCTPTDLVFPFFIFILGAAIPLAMVTKVLNQQTFLKINFQNRQDKNFLAWNLLKMPWKKAATKVFLSKIYWLH